MAVSGCGGGGDSTGSSDGGDSTPTAVIAKAEPTKAEFVKQGNAICKAGSEEIHAGADALKSELGLPEKASLSTGQEEELVSKVVVPAIHKQAEELAELGAPQGDSLQVGGIVNGLERVVATGEEDPANLLQVREGSGPLAEANKAAEQYGVAECTQP